MRHHLFGIRHHGPGSARALGHALERLAPDLVLVEGPPEASAAIPLLQTPGLEPPVALLVHADGRPELAAFFPFARFSPEWVAMRWALAAEVPVRFMDLSRGVDFALSILEQEGRPHPALEASGPAQDPLALLAATAGFADHELWWDLTFERRLDGRESFAAVAEVMRAVREGEPPPRGREALREAAMRTQLRAAFAEGFTNVAVVAGAFHVPALEDLGDDAADRARLAGLPRVGVRASWIPWTYPRLSWASGYGAGIESPGWYQHLFDHGRRAPTAWLVEAARLLRGDALSASSASVIEAVRLAESLAALRGHALPGLEELRDAAIAALADGRVEKLDLVRERLEIGTAIGRVPLTLGASPLAEDIGRAQRRLRLEPREAEERLELDLRAPIDLERSRLLHRLAIVGVDWGRRDDEGPRGRGTFREAWTLAWAPELPIRIAELAVHGRTLGEVATRVVLGEARTFGLPRLVALLEQLVAAALDEPMPALLQAIDARAASATELATLLRAIPPLVAILRRGDVRGTPAERVRPLLDALAGRVSAGLVGAAMSLDDDGAERLASAIELALGALEHADEARHVDALAERLGALVDAPWAHPLVRGLAARRLSDQARLDADALERHVARALGTTVEPRDAARWLEGLLRGGGALLVHQPALVGRVDGWLSRLDEGAFMSLVAPLRRAFSALEPTVRAELAARLEHGGFERAAASPSVGLVDVARAARVLPVLERVLGLTEEGRA